MSEIIDEKIRTNLVDNRLPCKVAFDIAKELKVNRREVGESANRLDVRISDCQLGFFQKLKATHDDLNGKVNDENLTSEITSSLDDGRLTCPIAFRIADKLKVTPKDVGDTATKQGIMVKNCQLGLFP